jgi:hypothetical protein
MTISFIGAQGNAGNTVSIPTHQIGDLILIFAYRDGNNTAPTTPAASGTVPTWNLIGSSGGNNNSSNFRWAIATATNTTSGTWTNATEIICLVYQKASIGASQGAGAQSATIAYPALTLQRTDGSSWVVGVAGHRTSTNVEVAPSGMINRAFTGTEAAGHDTDGGVSSWSQETVSAGANSGWRSWTVELRDTELDLIATAEAFTLVGEDVAFAKQVSLDVNTGSFVLTGNNSLLQRSLLLNNNVGSFAVAGQGIEQTAQRLLVADEGTFNLVGSNADLDYTPTSGQTLDVTTGAFTLSGNSVELNKNFNITLLRGQFNVNRISALLYFNRILNSFTRMFTVNSSTAILDFKRELIAITGPLILTRFNALFQRLTTIKTRTAKFAIRGKRPLFVRILLFVPPRILQLKRNEWILGQFTKLGRRFL